MVNGFCKNDVLLCFLEVEEFDVVIIFICIKIGIIDIMEFCECNGYCIVVLNGDMI